MLKASGYPERDGALSHTAQVLDVPISTLRDWYVTLPDPALSELRTKKTFDLQTAIRAELEGIFKTMPNARPTAAYRELATAAGILIDKLQILNGQPTWRVEIVNLLRDGTLTPDVIENELGNELARELFDAASTN